MEWLDNLRDFNTVSVIFRILLAFAVGGIIGIEREKSGRPAGLRTHILVCIGATMTSLIGLYATETLMLDTDPLRIAAQVVSGIGFLGVGTILVKGHDHITGLTTAAGLWATGTVGIALGAGFYEAALMCFAVMMLTTAILYRFEKKKTERRRGSTISIELRDAEKLNDFVKYMEEKYQIGDIHCNSPKTNLNGAIGIEMNITLQKEESYDEMTEYILKNKDVIYVL